MHFKDIAITIFLAGMHLSPLVVYAADPASASAAETMDVSTPGTTASLPAPSTPAADAPGAVSPTSLPIPAAPEIQTFREIWAYLMQNEERLLLADTPVTDIAYFSARINVRGELYGIPPIARLAASSARKHLVVAEVSNPTLVHFALDPAFPLRDRLLDSIAEAATPYDGVNIDFEALPLSDAPNFYDFLRLLKRRLGDKVLSVCVPGRTRPTNDAYDYAVLAAIVDRVFVMAYDEHWSGGPAGPVASLRWTRQVVSWALQTIGPEKLIMGLPFYGRAWGSSNPAGAYKHSRISQMLNERDVVPVRTDEDILSFSFTDTITYTVYFDDSLSLHRRISHFRSVGATMIGFWRIGQEDPAIWPLLATPLSDTAATASTPPSE